MQTRFLLLVVCISCAISHKLQSQTGYATELRNSVKIPNSPAGQAFEKYGDVNVNLYTGTPDIRVPLYTHQGRELDLPMELTYDATGVKVQQEATQVGLSWNLNLGGRINRIVNGRPDDYLSTSPAYFTFRDQMPSGIEPVSQKMLDYASNSTTFQSTQAAKNYLDFLKDVNRGLIDTQLDFFSLNVLGINDMIVFDLTNHEPRTLNNKRIKVSASFTGSSLTSWVVTHEDGTRFFFEQAESTTTAGSDYKGPGDAADVFGLHTEYNSSWLLTKIISPNHKDEYVFHYTDFGYWTQEGIMAPAVMEVNIPDGNLTANNYLIEEGVVTKFQTQHRIKEKFVTDAFHNGTKILAFNLKPREDHEWNSAIDDILVYNIGTGTPNQTIRFDHSYFGSGSSVLDKRLKLDKVHFLDGQGNSEDNYYEFEYKKPNEVPSRTSLAQDYMGYFNGKTTNTVLYPRVEVGEDVYQGANREADFDKAIIGTLFRMYYPTKGHTDFVYEKHGEIIEMVIQDVEVHVGGNYANPGTGNGSECGGYCIDKWDYPGPVITSKVIHIATTKSYKVVSSISVPWNEIYLTKLDNNQKLPFEDVRTRPQTGFWITGDETNMVLDAGYYQITVANGGVAPVALNISEVQRRPVPVVKGDYAGIRIRSITDYTATYNDLGMDIASRKRYRYSKRYGDYSEEQSSRKVVFQPNLWYQLSRSNAGSNINYIMRTSTSSGGNQPHIAYEKVFEINTRLVPSGPVSNTYEPIGYTEYNFTAGRSGLQSTGVPPNINSYYTNVAFGKKNNHRVYKMVEGSTNHTKVEEEIDQYTQFYYFGQSSLYTVHDETANNHYALIYKSGADYRIQPVPAEAWCYAGSLIPHDYYISGCPAAIKPNICNQPDNTCYGSFEMASLSLRENAISGIYGAPQSVEMRTFENGQASPFITRTEMTYETDHYLTRKVQVSDSRGGFQERHYKYPFDQSAGVYQSMENDNFLSSIVQVETFERDEQNQLIPLYTEKNNYEPFGQAYLPSSKEVAKGSHTLEVREHYQYDSDQNLKQENTIQSQGMNVAYLWSYAGRYMVARVENATYDDLVSVLGATIIVNLRNATPTDAEVRTALAPLYTLQNAHVTIFTHIPGWGISSLTDVNQDITFYEYDSHGRLEFIKDDELNIVRKYDYNLMK